MNEHRVFLPYIGLVLSAVWGCRLLLAGRGRRERRRRPVRGDARALAVGTHTRNRVWLTSESLWADVTAKSPGNGRAWMNYGTALMARGALREGPGCYERAARCSRPTTGRSRSTAASSRMPSGNPAAAEPHFKRAIELGPGQPDAHYFFARWLVRSGRGPEAAEHLKTAIRLSPGAVLGPKPSHGSAGGRRRRSGGRGARPGSARRRPVERPGAGLSERRGSLPTSAPTPRRADRRESLSGRGATYVASAMAYRAALSSTPPTRTPEQPGLDDGEARLLPQASRRSRKPSRSGRTSRSRATTSRG